LLDRGLRQFKFVDRTFNLNLNISKAILQFFLERYRPGLFLHFEMIPDRLPEALRSLIRQFPPGALQFEVGIQTFNETVSGLISRRQDNLKLEDNLRFLRNETGVHIHTDLIVGLPGEDLASFAAGFDRLVAMNPQEIQVGILKRLRGTPLPEWAIVGGVIGSSVIVAALISTVTLLFAVLVYNVQLPASHVLPLIVTILLGAAVFCSLGIAVSALMPNADSAPALVNFPYFILMSASGGFGPVSGGVARVTSYFPLRPFITGVYRAFDPSAFGGSGWEWHNLATLAIWGVVGIVIAIRRFRWTPRNG